jgi:hypothetical protein
MSEDDPEHRNLPAVIEPQWPPKPPEQSKWPWPYMVALVLLGLAVYSLFFRGDHSKTEQTPLPDGWLELGGCTETRSIDGHNR